MSYEGKMLEDLRMPDKKNVKKALLKILFKHKGDVKEFSVGEDIVNEIADNFNLNDNQRNAILERFYLKEKRIVKTPLWHRLLYRAADSLAKEKLLSRPTTTFRLTNKKEWMLTEKGMDEALKLLNIQNYKKEFLPTKSFEVQKIVKKINETTRPVNYNPFEKKKRTNKITKKASIRSRGFRHAVIEAYAHKCAVCGLKINSPDSMIWEVEAAHIVPYSLNGRDDIWNGIALCHLHHWAFDVGWFTLLDDYSIKVSSKIHNLPKDYGMIGDYSFINTISTNNNKIFLPVIKPIYPHIITLQWHRKNIFYN